MKLKLKKWFWLGFKISAVLTCFLLIGLIWAWNALQNPEYQSYLARELTAQLPEPWKSHAKCGRIGGRIPGYFLLEKLEVLTANGDQIELHQIEFSWDWSALLSGEIIINKIHVNSLALLLKQNEEKKWLPDLLGGEDEVAPVVEAENKEPFAIPSIQVLLKEFSLSDIKVKLVSKEDSWSELNYHLPNLNLVAEVKQVDSELSGDLHLNTSMNLTLDQFPKCSLTSEIELSYVKEVLKLQLKTMKLDTKNSHISLSLDTKINKLNLNDLSTNSLFNQLESTIRLLPSVIDKDELKIINPSVELPDSIKLNGDIELKNKEVTTALFISCLDNKIESNLKVTEINLEDIMTSKVSSKLNIFFKPDGLVPDIEGEVKTDLVFGAKLSDLHTWELTQQLNANLTYKKFQLPFITESLVLKNKQVEMKQNLKSDSLDLSQTVDVSLSDVQDILKIDLESLLATYKLTLEVDDFERALKPWQEIGLIDLPLKGSTKIEVELEGGLSSLSYKLKTQLNKLVLDSALPNEIHLSTMGKLSPKTFIELDTPPVFPELTFGKETLVKELQLLGDALNESLSLVELPEIKFSFSGNELMPILNEGSLSILPIGEKEHRVSLNLKNEKEESLSKLDFTFNLGGKDWFFDLKHLWVNSQLAGDWNHTWLEQALELQQPCRAHLNWEKVRLTWSPLNLGKDKWFQTEGSIEANGELKAGIQVQLPKFETWLETLPLESPMTASGQMKLNSNLSGTWFRPKALIHLEGVGLSAEKEALPKLILEKFESKILLDSNDAKSIDVAFDIQPKDEAGFYIKVLQPLSYKPEVWLPELIEKLTFDIGTKGGSSMSFKPIKMFIPKEVEGLAGKWGVELKGSVPLAKVEDLDFSGSFKLAHVKANIKDLPELFEEINVDIGFSPTKVSFKQFEIQQKEGGLFITGLASSENLMSWNNPKWDTNIKLKQFGVQFQKAASLMTKADISLKGILSQHTIKGYVEVNDILLKPQYLELGPSSLAARDPNLEILPELKSWEEYDKEVEGKEKSMPDALKTALIDLKIKLGQNNWIRHDMFTGELVGLLNVKKDHGQENLHPIGEVSLKKSVLKFQGNRFNMDQGDLIWQGDLIPAIDMTFKTEVDPYEIDLVLNHNQADLVKPEFRSRPWLDNSDIISVLLIGRPLHAEAQQGDGDNNFAQDLAVSQGVSHVTKELGLENLGVDIDNVSSKGGTVRVGRYLHPRVYVSVAKKVGEEESNELSLEYLILKNLKFKITQETEVPVGFDVEWTKDY